MVPGLLIEPRPFARSTFALFRLIMCEIKVLFFLLRHHGIFLVLSIKGHNIITSNQKRFHCYSQFFEENKLKLTLTLQYGSTYLRAQIILSGAVLYFQKLSKSPILTTPVYTCVAAHVLIASVAAVTIP